MVLIGFININICLSVYQIAYQLTMALLVLYLLYLGALTTTNICFPG